MHVIQSKTANAMASADGSIFVYTGLLHEMKNVDETAFILSHEISHVLLRHVPHQICTSGLATGVILMFLSLLDSELIQRVKIK